MTSNVITIDHVSKRFQRNVDRRRSVKERIVRGRPTSTREFWALRDVSLTIPQGSVYGLIGHNGSGKSTLLKLITGIYRPTSGTITSQGRIAALIELGAGFHPDMTGRENIRLNGAILGLSKKEISEATEEIIDFSGLREFIDDPVKNYSSGMYVRLGFSVAVNLKPDILLVDEVLAVGDEEFQRKCFDHLTALRKTGTTIVVVSHGLGQIEALCDEVTWLDRGRVADTGPSHSVVSAYLEKVNADESDRNPRIEATRSSGDRRSNSLIEITRATITDATGKPLDHAETGTTFCVTVGMTAHEEVLGPNVRVALQHDSGPLVAMVNNHRHNVDFGYVQGERTVTVALTDNPLLPGRYIVHLDVFDHTGARVIDTWNNALEFVVRSQRGEIGQGFVDLPAAFRIE